MQDLDIVQCAAQVQTQHVIVNLNMNEYAYSGQGPSIHSSGQIEWYNNFVDDKSTQVGGTQVIITYGGYIMPLVSKEGLMYLELIGKPTNEDLLITDQSTLLTSTHPWDPTMPDAPNPHHRLTTDGREHGSQNGLQKVQNQNIYQQETLMASSDPDVIMIHLQSSLCSNLTPKINPMLKSFQHHQRMGS